MGYHVIHRKRALHKRILQSRRWWSRYNQMNKVFSHLETGKSGSKVKGGKLMAEFPLIPPWEEPDYGDDPFDEDEDDGDEEYKPKTANS